MPNIDSTSVKYNTGGVGYTSYYLPSTSPAGDLCNLPALTPLLVPTLDESLTTLLGGCKFQFPLVVPSPPVFIPKVQLPPIPCPTVDYCNGSNISFIGQGNASVGGSLEIIQNPDNSCCSSIIGSIIVSVPTPPCPTGVSFTGSCPISFVGSVAGETTLQTLDLNIQGGPCDFSLVGCQTINLPPIPCPNGTTFTSNVSITTGEGTSQAPISIELTGGPCDFSLTGGGVINIPCASGMSFSGSVGISVEGGSTRDANGNVGPITMQLVGGPCNYQLVGGGTIVIPTSGGGGGVSAGDYMPCPSDTSDLISLDSDTGNTLINFPTPCYSCSADGTNPMQLKDISDVHTIKASLIEGSSCCSNPDILAKLDLCAPQLVLGDPTGSGATITIDPGNENVFSITNTAGGSINATTDKLVITGVTGNTVTIDSSVPTGQNIQFVQVTVCNGGTTQTMWVLGSNPF